MKNSEEILNESLKQFGIETVSVKDSELYEASLNAISTALRSGSEMLYNMMLNNARTYISKSKPVDGLEHDSEHINAFEISEVLSILTCKAKEDIILEIANKKS